ncbi:MAG: TlpA family protein disulfide reductase [Planctomycetaceae bacterium]
MAGCTCGRQAGWRGMLVAGLSPLILALGTAASPAAAAGVEVGLVDTAGLEAQIARHRGRVVVVDCWSTSCPPCVKEFPRLLELQRRHGAKIACISLSLDYEGIDAPEDVLPPVRAFLEKVKADGIVNLLCTEEADVVYRKLDLVSVPAVYVYAADGALVRRFDEDDATKRLGRPFTYDDVGAEVEALLAK